jgi:hypothetical protein
LTTLPGLDGSGEIMLGGLEGIPGEMLRFTDEDPGHPVEELDIDQFLASVFGPPVVRNVLSAYNDIPHITNPADNSSVFLIGLFVHQLPTEVENDAWFLSRTLDAHYALHRVPHFDRSEAFPDGGPLRGIRSITVSPFPRTAARCFTSAASTRTSNRATIAPGSNALASRPRCSRTVISIPGRRRGRRPSSSGRDGEPACAGHR